MVRFIRWIATILILTALSIQSWGQQRNTPGLYGRVMNAQGASVIDASVTLTNVETGIRRASVSNHAGEWEFPPFPVGAYTLSVEKAGFSRVEQTTLRVCRNKKPQRRQLPLFFHLVLNRVWTNVYGPTR